MRIVTMLLFAVVGRMVYDRTHTRDLSELETMNLSKTIPFAAVTCPSVKSRCSLSFERTTVKIVGDAGTTVVVFCDCANVTAVDGVGDSFIRRSPQR